MERNKTGTHPIYAEIDKMAMGPDSTENLKKRDEVRYVPGISLAQVRAPLADHKIMEEKKVLPSAWFIVKKVPFHGIVPALMVIVLTLFPLLASADEELCRETGIYVGNQTTLDVWYKRNGGSCTKWNHGHILIMKPKDTLIIYKDMTCKTEYCSKNPTYDVYKSLDANQNCRLRILPDCTLSDM